MALLAPAAPARAERILATGDSMMYVIQKPLRERLEKRGHVVKVDGRFGTGLTKPWVLDWVKHAREQVAEFRPDITIMFIGASDAFPLGEYECCGPEWRGLYIWHVRELIRIYGRTVWMTLPAPRDPGLARVHRHVNRAIREGVEGYGQIVDLVPVFTPGWRYRRKMRWNGKRVIVRQRDGVHIGYHGDWIASSMAINALNIGR